MSDPKNPFEALFGSENEFTKIFNDVGKHKSSPKETTTNISLYTTKIKVLEQQIIFLANICATISTKPHEQNSDHWLALAAKFTGVRNGVSNPNSV